MHTATLRALAATAFAALALLAGAAEAGGRHGGHGGRGYGSGHHAHGHHGHGGHRHHRGSVSIGIGFGWGGYLYGAPWAYPPGYGVVVPPVVYYGGPQAAPPREPAVAKGPPDPIFYPKNGQSPQQIEADLHDCNRWAMDQPDAIARADVFHRATLACMEGRGYTVR